MTIDIEFLTPKVKADAGVNDDGMYISENSYFIEAGMGNNPRKITKYTLLVQKWLSTFMTNPGSDITDLDYGGGGIQLMDESFSEENLGDLRNKLNIAVSKTNKDISTSQLEEGIEDPDEMLDSARLSKLNIVSADAIEVEFVIVSMSGNTSSVMVPIMSA